MSDYTGSLTGVMDVLEEEKVDTSSIEVSSYKETVDGQECKVYRIRFLTPDEEFTCAFRVYDHTPHTIFRGKARVLAEDMRRLQEEYGS